MFTKPLRKLVEIATVQILGPNMNMGPDSVSEAPILGPDSIPTAHIYNI